MAKITYRTILVIGDNPDEIVKKYSADTKLPKHVKVKFSDANKKRLEQLRFMEKLFENKFIYLTEEQYDYYKEMYLRFKKMDDVEFFKELTNGCEYDPETGDALTEENENAFYKYERCQQHRLEVTGEEGDFSDPFPLKNGGKSYSAHFDDIDWKKIHKNAAKVELNKRVWELVVEDDKPRNNDEEVIKNRMVNRYGYFGNFKTKEEFVEHSTSLWYWGVATDKWYKEVNYKVSDYNWITRFYNRFIRDLKKTNPLITIYEVHSLD